METRLIAEKTIEIGEFKSYYVVWKHFTERGKTQRKNSLNRTM